MTREEHDQLVTAYAEGSIAITVPRNVARQFFIRVPRADVKEETGFTFFYSKAAVWIGLLLAPALLVFSLGLIIIYYGWLSTIYITFAGVLWSVIAGFLNPEGGWKPVTIPLLVLVVFQVFEWADPEIVAVLLTWVASLAVHRATYMGAQVLLINLILHSFAAYDMLEAHIQTIDSQAQV